jgi:hypothetical protein
MQRLLARFSHALQAPAAASLWAGWGTPLQAAQAQVIPQHAWHVLLPGGAHAMQVQVAHWPSHVPQRIRAGQCQQSLRSKYSYAFKRAANMPGELLAGPPPRVLCWSPHCVPRRACVLEATHTWQNHNRLQSPGRLHRCLH